MSHVLRLSILMLAATLPSLSRAAIRSPLGPRFSDGGGASGYIDFDTSTNAILTCDVVTSQGSLALSGSYVPNDCSNYINDPGASC